ncbi:MAG TPA: hypothetical protein VGB26_03555 [Nitrospiria bacterium]
MSEMVITRNYRHEAVVSYLAESGIQQVLLWFNQPETFFLNHHFNNGYTGSPQLFFQKRWNISNGTPTYFNNGKSQFTGTPQNPDLLISVPNDDPFLNDPGTGLFKDFSDLGKILQLKIYQPSGPEGLCIVESRAEGKSGFKKTIQVELTASPLIPLNASIQSGIGFNGKGVPVWAHWGEVWVSGKGSLGTRLDQIPVLNPFAATSGASYSIGPLEDPWVQFRIEGSIQSPTPLECTSCPEPYLMSGHGNVHQDQGFYNPGFSLSLWDYQTVKEFSKRFGRYYSTDSMGNLYLDGIQDAQNKNNPQAVFSSQGPGDHQGLVFIDTIDQNPPTSTNQATLTVPVDYSQGIFFVNGNVVLEKKGPGKTLSVSTPPLPQTGTPVSKVLISNININGVIYTNGFLKTVGSLKAFGSLHAQGGFVQPENLEVWKNHNHSLGRFHNLPMAVFSQGSWRETY